MNKILAALLLSFVPALPAAVITTGQISNFQEGGTAGWSNGGPAADPQNVATGGPAGAGDNFLQIMSDGSGSGGKLTIFNRSEWAGDFSGVNGIRVELANLGATALTVRLSLRSGTSGGAASYVTSDSLTLPADGVWRTGTFSFSSLVALGGPAALPAFLTNVAEMRVFHSAEPTTGTGQNVTGSLGLDNLRAIPEPGAAALACGALLLLWRRFR